ncbi:alpha/beta fold hydrolase [Paraburkholderia youngii]|uniref:alpha/beta fold hydrolase n=1 Tax=Paraburkholderia youngii TaxID=2782701 RepID=UPI003D20998F
MVNNAPVLFLHGGPGLSAIAERELYGHTMPVHWWDQPRSVVLYADAFSALMEAAEDELKALSERAGAPVNLLAHSFGTHLALRLASSFPGLVNEVTLPAPVRDLGDAFIRTGERLRSLYPEAAPLVDALEDFRRERDYELFAKLAAQITSFANFIDVYWAKAANARRCWYIDLLAHYPVLDANAFEVLVKSFWAHATPTYGDVLAPVHIVSGALDCLVDAQAEAQSWKNQLDCASCQIIDCGHFVHLEQPPSVWWPRDWPRVCV